MGGRFPDVGSVPGSLSVGRGANDWSDRRRTVRQIPAGLRRNRCVRWMFFRQLLGDGLYSHRLKGSLARGRPTRPCKIRKRRMSATSGTGLIEKVAVARKESLEFLMILLAEQGEREKLHKGQEKKPFEESVNPDHR